MAGQRRKRRTRGATGLAGMLALGAMLALPAASNADTVTLSQNEGGSGINFFAGDGSIHPGDVFPSTITGPAGTVNDVNATLQVNHNLVDDLDVALVSPNGTAVHLMSDACGNDPGFNNFKFDDAAAINMSNLGPCDASLTYDVSNYDGTGMGEVDIYSPPAAFASTLNALSFFNGGPSGGAWKLFAMDDLTGNGGAITTWSITLDFTPTPAATPTPLPTPLPINKCKKKKKRGKKSAASAACKKKKRKK